MYYYQKHIGDYRSATAHLDLLHHGVYQYLMETCYMNEQPLPIEVAKVCRLCGARTQEEKEAVQNILDEFFTLTEKGWVNSRVEKEINAYHANSDKNRTNGAKGGRPRKNKTQNNPVGFDSVSSGLENDANSKPNQKATINHKPLTINQEPVTNINITADESAKNPKPRRITKKQKAINALIEMGVGEKYAQAVIEKRKGSVFTELAIEEIKLQAEAVNLNFVQAIEFAAKQEWGSFRADWYQNRMAKQQQAYHSQNQANPWAEYNQRVGEQFNQNEMVDVTPKKSVLIEEVGHV